MKKESNQAKGARKAQELREYIDTNDSFPMYQGKLNKTAIFRQLDIGKSLQGSNPAIKKILKDLEKDIANNKEMRRKPVQCSSEQDALLEAEIYYLKTELLKAQTALEFRERADFAEAFNVRTGKLIYMPE